MEGLRLAALKLHGMAPEDRVWVLDRLDPGARRQLRSLLQDLKRSGIDPAQAGAVQGEVAARPAASREKDATPARAEAAPAQATPASQTLTAEMVARLDQADAERVARVLKAEPEWVAAIVLAAHRWKWGAAVNEKLRPGSALAEPRLRATVPPALTGALLRALAQRAADAASPSESSFDRVMDNLDPLVRSRRPGLWNRVRQWMT
jgi:hypothetical protein